jgi:hypothetical protein
MTVLCMPVYFRDVERINHPIALGCWRISVESEAGRGSTFVFMLLAAINQPAEQPWLTSVHQIDLRF